MTTTIKKAKSKLPPSQAPATVPAPKAKRAAKKPLRIREELLPDSARYITIDDVEYVALPVAEFGDWYEDALDGAVLEDRERDQVSTEPFQDAVSEIRTAKKSKP